MTGKRANYITWDEYFMGVASLSAMRSKDPNTQVGATTVSPRAAPTTSSRGAKGIRIPTTINIST